MWSLAVFDAYLSLSGVSNLIPFKERTIINGSK
jgi:hypothetical protein